METDLSTAGQLRAISVLPKRGGYDLYIQNLTTQNFFFFEIYVLVPCIVQVYKILHSSIHGFCISFMWFFHKENNFFLNLRIVDEKLIN